MTFDHTKSPFPWFGGKSQAAPAVWAALGDVDHYVEPFAGSLAVLLRRPHTANRPYYSETVNDADGLLINAWRSIQLSPEATAAAASWPVAEADMHARHVALLRWRAERQLEHLMGDPGWHDPVMAGWWLWGVSCWIGGGWCSGSGPWTADSTGRLVKQPRQTLREEGVNRKLPHLSDNGQGVNAPRLREEGVNRKRPHLSHGGQGVNAPRLREEGVAFHDLTMPKILTWMRALSARLRHVRILNGDWQRTLTNGATKTLSVRNGGVCGVFLDPPYSHDVRDAGVYAHDDTNLAAASRDWAQRHGDDPKYRIVLAGFDTEHAALEDAGWRVVEWFTAGWLTGGMGNTGDGHQQHRERLWLSPHCLGQVDDPQMDLFAEVAE